MNKQSNLPRTPFSTPLSGSAKETELRLRAIFTGPKKRPPVLFLVLICSLCLLCGNLVSCQSAQAEESPTGQPEPLAAPTADNGQDALRQVLLGQASFTGENGQLLSMDNLTPAVTDTPDLEARATRFTVLDLDGDEEPEAVLWLALGENESAGFLILRWEDGQVRSYYRSLRALQELKADGTFTFSSGAADWGFGSLRFESGECVDMVETYCESGENEELYFIRHTDYIADGSGGYQKSISYEPIPPENFQWFAARQEYKPGVYWMEPTEENITAALAEPNKYHVYHLNVTGERSLTLLCHTTTADQLDPSRYPSPAYRYIQVFDGEELLQTISEDTVLQEERYLFEGFAPDYGLDVQDVNFDGALDFGILCGRTYNGPVYWFLWDESSRQFRPGFFSALDLSADPETRQLTDTWKDGSMGFDVYTYQWNAQGQRIQTNHRRTDYPLP